jgi:hypothetical protein
MKTIIEHLEEIKSHYEGWICSTEGFVKELEEKQSPPDEKVRLEAYYSKNLTDYRAKIAALNTAIEEMSHVEV